MEVMQSDAAIPTLRPLRGVHIQQRDHKVKSVPASIPEMIPPQLGASDASCI